MERNNTIDSYDQRKKVKSRNVQVVGTFFDTFLNLGHLLLYNFKMLACQLISPKCQQQNVCPSNIVWNFLRPFLKTA